MTKLNKSDEGRKDRGSERWEYPPGRARIIPASQQRPVCDKYVCDSNDLTPEAPLVSTFQDKPLGESTCGHCGECVKVCPVGSLVFKKHSLDKYLPPETKLLKQ